LSDGFLFFARVTARTVELPGVYETSRQTSQENVEMKRTKLLRLVCATAAAALLAVTGAPLVHAQGVTTGSIAGVVADAQGAVVPGATVVAVHQPSGTSYEGVSQADGRFVLGGVRVGGPYKVTVSLTGFATDIKEGVTVSLGTSTDLDVKLKIAAIAEEVVVTATSDPIFSTTHTGPATAISRDDLATLPTISGRITDIIRLSPQYGGQGTFSGQDNRANNITIDGSYFNGSFGLDTTTGTPGDRTGVAPISLEAIEQVQVSVAPYDVRQGNFVGANVNTVTRSGTNLFTGSAYTRYRNQSYVGTDAAGQVFNPQTFKTTATGEWVGGPIIKNKLFFFQSFEKQDDNRPLTTFQSNPGGVASGGNITRVLASDLNALSSYLATNFKYDTGPFDNLQSVTPAKPWIIKANYNLSNAHKVNFRYNRLTSSTDKNQSTSSSLGAARTSGTQFLTFQNSNYKMLENIDSSVGELNSVFGTLTNNLIIGDTIFDEPRGQINLFPFVVIGAGDQSAYTAFGSEPFTPFNLLNYKTFQVQDTVTKFSKNHSWTFGGSYEKFHSDNSFYFGIQSAYSYNTLADFYADANSYLANPNRTVSPVNLQIFQVKYLLQPGQTTPPMQQLDVVYAGGYVQDEWRPRGNLTVTSGLRVDVPRFGNTAFDNPLANGLTFRDQNGSAVQYNSGGLPEATPYWSPRVGFNWDALSNGTTQVRGGTGVFTGKPPYVWISNQIGNTGVLYGFLDVRNTTAFPFNPNPDRYKPVPTGGVAGSYELDVTDKGFRFPQTWRTSFGVDRRLPWGMTGTFDYIYNRDLNSPVYLNANLPAPEGAFTGVDNRPRWAATAAGAPLAPGITVALPTCAANGQVGPCSLRLNNAPGNQVTAAYVIKNQSQNRSWNIAASLSKAMTHGLSFSGGYSYGVSKSLVEPSSTAGSSWGSANPIVFDPNNPPLANSVNSPGNRVFFTASYTRQYFSLGATTVSMFYQASPNINNFATNASYVFSGDANGDNAFNNDLIYIPRDISEMNFKTLPPSASTGGATFTPAQQAAAFEQYIQNDEYLRTHRGQYAERGAFYNPLVNRIDLSILQSVFHKAGGAKHSGEIRLDITNFGNLLNHNWGVSQRLINNQILTSPTADAQGRLTYNMQVVSGNLLTTPWQTSAGTSDVYVMMLSFRYSFN
jgi:Carboxypeptidase regulatory-like domain